MFRHPLAFLSVVVFLASSSKSPPASSAGAQAGAQPRASQPKAAPSVVAGKPDKSAPTMKERSRLQGHTQAVYTVAFSPDGKMLASGSQDNSVRLWDVASAKSTATLDPEVSTVRLVAFSPDGKKLVVG